MFVNPAANADYSAEWLEAMESNGGVAIRDYNFILSSLLFLVIKEFLL